VPPHTVNICYTVYQIQSTTKQGFHGGVTRSALCAHAIALTIERGAIHNRFNMVFNENFNYRLSRHRFMLDPTHRLTDERRRQMGPTSFDERGLEHDHDLHAHVCAYNMAFAELGLRFRWDASTLASLASIDCEKARIVAYIQSHHPHLLNAYSAEFLSQAILERKNAQRPQAPERCDAVAAETKRPSAVQVRVREMKTSSTFPDDVGLPLLAGA
jgi:hypothetical protein